jgi:hypothetical protein
MAAIKKKEKMLKIMKVSTLMSFYILWLEMGHLLESHLLEKTAQHQNLDCSTPFEQMNKYMQLLKNKKQCHFKQMQVLDQNAQLLK